MMIEHVRVNEAAIQNKTYKRCQKKEAITDPVIWCYAMLQFTSTLVIGCIGVSSNLIIVFIWIQYSADQLFNIAPGTITIIVIVGDTTLAQSSKQTIWVIYVSISSLNLVNITDTRSGPCMSQYSNSSNNL